MEPCDGSVVITKLYCAIDCVVYCMYCCAIKKKKINKKERR